MRRFFLLFTVVFLVAGCSGEPQIRFALEEVEGSVQDAYAQRFKALIEERSEGRIKVNVYPYGALGSSAQLTEQVQNGALQFAFASPGHLGSVVPEVQVFSLHFLFSDDEQVNQQIFTGSGELKRLLGEAYRERNLELLSIVQEGWMVWTGDRPLRSPSDFEGFKIRTMPSPLLVEAYQAYGANPTPMPYSEVYGALQLNMIDGQVNPIFAIEEMSFYEVQEVLTFANHLPFVSTLVANPDFLAGLSESDRELVESVRAELDEEIFELQQRFNRERLETIREESDIQVVRLVEEEREVFRDAAMPVRDSYIKSAGERGAVILKAVTAARNRLEQ
ncbi:TRAP transporter substrate-binding protein [Thiohalomonas denitrificans]|uniref:Tripartite ATP-independent transporter solute receptor, DctP family n=1 Tax=Thiohalomonas denitrificans TaxID=415747 RepID=A0A1G5QTG2_9GAMM|nr:TRAP transporter substrate-binding protein DctP [Thiohalomonas denitrificans]SCZ65042.1 tripartite ATP-independent transporter solute receptor, DctP family [Thiohalomonas denitrificans]